MFVLVAAHWTWSAYRCGRGEIMAKVVAGCSKLKTDDYRYKAKGIEKICGLCDISAYEDPRHMIMRCEATHDICVKMFEEICNIDQDHLGGIIRGHKCYEILLGANPDNVDRDQMMILWQIAGDHICEMYRSVISQWGEEGWLPD